MRSIKLIIINLSLTIFIIIITHSIKYHHRHQLARTQQQTIVGYHHLHRLKLRRHLSNPSSTNDVVGQSDTSSADHPHPHPPPSDLSYYSKLYYHHSNNPIIRRFIILSFIIWLGFLFSFLGIVASDFFCPNLSTISSSLGLSESLAGVTLLGFGNGAPDVFSTYAALKANTGSLAIGELIGSGSFIVLVVVGSMSIIRPFKVPRHSFLRDLGFFIIAIIFITFIISDRLIRPWESNLLILLYFTYVASVLYSNWFVHKKLIKLAQLRTARSQYAQDDHQLLEPYLDDPDFPSQPTQESSTSSPSLTNPTPNDHHAATKARSSPQLELPPNSRSGSTPIKHTSASLSSLKSHDSFQNLLENSYPVSLPVCNRRMRAPSLSYRPILSDPLVPLNLSTSSYHPPTNVSLAHPSGSNARSVSSQDGTVSPTLPDHSRRRRRNTIVIRPSLLSAIEFRDVVNSLSRDSTSHAARIYPAIHPQLSPSSTGARRRLRSDSLGVGAFRASNASSSDSPRLSFADRNRRITEFDFPGRSTEAHIPLGPRRSSLIQSAIEPPSPRPWELEGFNIRHSPHPSPHHSPTDISITITPTGNQNLSSEQTTTSPIELDLQGVKPPSSDPPLRSSLSSRQLERNLSPSQARVVNDPLPSILITSDRHEVIQLPDSPHDRDDGEEEERAGTRIDRNNAGINFAIQGSKCHEYYRRWKVLIRVMAETLLPTLKGWRMKSLLGKFLAVFSIPAVFVLTLTLPVVTDDQSNVEEDEDDEEMDMLMEDTSEFDQPIDHHPFYHRPSMVGLGLIDQVSKPHQQPPHDDERHRRTLIRIDEDDDDDDNQGVIPPKSLRFNGSDHHWKNQGDQTEMGRGLEIQMGVVGSVKHHDNEDGELIIERNYQSSSIDLRRVTSSSSVLMNNEDENRAKMGLNELEEEAGGVEDDYTDEHIARVLATVQTTLTPTFWLICFGVDNNDGDDNPGNAPNGIEVTMSRIKISKSNMQIVLSVLIGLGLGRLVYKSLYPLDEEILNKASSREVNRHHHYDHENDDDENYQRNEEQELEEESLIRNSRFKDRNPTENNNNDDAQQARRKDIKERQNNKKKMKRGKNLRRNNDDDDDNKDEYYSKKKLRKSRKMRMMIIKSCLCIIGFLNSMVWILKIVDQVIENIKFLGLIFNISHSILGLIILGIGNSLGDLIANITVARMGFPLMALSACFGGPLLNILLGIGISSNLVMRMNGLKSEGIKLEVASKSLLISSTGLLFNLILILIFIPTLKKFKFDPFFGACLIFSYLLILGLNLLFG